MVITIDGPAGAGKTTVAHALAASLGFRHLDTGAMYRAVTLRAIEDGLDLTDGEAVARLASRTEVHLVPTGGPDQVLANGRDVSQGIRTTRIDQAVSLVAVLSPVRAELVRKQRAFAEGQDVVAEGRDMGTVVFPDAALKVYLDAAPGERARRRTAENAARGVGEADLRSVEAEQRRRDTVDRSRAVAPMRPADDAVLVDSTGLGLDEVVARLMALARERQAAKP